MSVSRGDLYTPFKDAIQPTCDSKSADGASFGKPATSDMPAPTPSTDIKEVQFAEIAGVESGMGGAGE